MPRVTVESPGAMKLATPGSGVTETAAASTRANANGVHTSPIGSTRVRRHSASAEPRVKSPGTPRSRQLAGILTSGLATGVHRFKARAFKVIGLKSASERLRLVRLKR